MDIKYLIILLFLFYILIYIIKITNIINKIYNINTIKKTVSFADENNKPLQTFIKIVN